MDIPVDLRLSGGLTLHELLQSLEEEDDVNTDEVDIVLMPPENCLADLTDEDSGDENFVSIDNLPGSQLRAEAEVMEHLYEELWEEENNIPLSLLKVAMKKSYEWSCRDLERTSPTWPIKEKTGPRKVAVAAFVDVERAYDKVWREAVVFKMKKSGVPIDLIKVTRSWLEGRRFRGSPPSPLLFNIFMLDLPNAIAVPSARVFQFADDTAIVVQGLNLETSLKKLEQGLKEVGVFAANWNMKINESKTEVVKFTKKIPRRQMKINESKTEVVKFTKKIPRRQFILWNSRKIRVKNQATYLGITVDSRLSFESHVRRRGALAAASTRKLYPILRRESRLSLVARRKIFKVVPLPSNNYGEELWIKGSERAKNRVEINARKLARFIGNFPWVARNAEIRELFQLEDLRARARRRRTEAGLRMRNHPSAQIQGFAAKIS
ncbi:Reverse transcriptase (RNA-dependent DNA polymerase) [Popillia japonica]|uniref:Reverse transcriptase (RNA-dependent DNA polymerase) n=1 Tax=Popillia japonica TaxID=7064 RepID=A0AAW1KFZ3_POPJA